MNELEALDPMRVAALERARLNSLRRKLYFDKKVITSDYSIGNPVLLAKGNTCKFETEFLGPYKVVNMCPFGTIQPIDMEGNIKQDLVHKDRIKHVSFTLEEHAKFTPRANYIVDEARKIYNKTSSHP